MKIPFIIIFVTAIYVASGSIAFAQPRIQVDTQNIEPDFYGDENYYTVNIRNVGDSTLDFRITIDYMRGDGWLDIDRNEAQIEPNEDMNFDVHFDSWEMESGDYNASIHILNNDPDDSDVIIHYFVHIYPVPMMLHLQTGWNLVSTYYLLDHNNIVDLFQGIRNSLIIVKDAEGRFYLPEREFNNIPFWDFRQGYLVKMDEAADLWLNGHPAPQDTTIPLTQGWNIVAYFPEANVEAPDAFQNIADQLLVAKDVDGNFYIPGRNFNNMPALRRGQGYFVKVSAEVDLIWFVH